MLRGVWQALNCLSIHGTYCVIVAGASPGETKKWAAVKTAIFCTCGSNNCETVGDRWVHAARGLASTELSFHLCNVLRDCHRSVPRRNKNVVKIAIFGLTHWLKHRITRKLLKIDRFMLRGLWQALNCLSIRGIYCVRGVSRGNKNVGCSMWKRRFFALAVRITLRSCKWFGKHWIIVFSFMQRFAWFPQGRPQEKQKCSKNSDFWTYALT